MIHYGLWGKQLAFRGKALVSGPKSSQILAFKGRWEMSFRITSYALGSQDDLKYQCCVHTTRERVPVPRAPWFELVDLTGAPQLERGYLGAKRAGGSLGTGQSGGTPWELAGQSVRAWDPSHRPSKGAGQPWGSQGRPASYSISGAGTDIPRLGWNGAAGPRGRLLCMEWSPCI